jgi:hypothetical protein
MKQTRRKAETSIMKQDMSKESEELMTGAKGKLNQKNMELARIEKLQHLQKHVYNEAGRASEKHT